jgi:hypothetical protein
MCASSSSPVNLHNCFMLCSHYVGHCITAFVFYSGLLVVVFPKCAVHCQFSRIQGSHFTVLIIGITFIYFQNVYPWNVDATYKLLLWILCPFRKASRVHVSGYGKWQFYGAWAAWYLGGGGNNWASLSLGDINTESWSSRIGVGHETDKLILYKVNCW